MSCIPGIGNGQENLIIFACMPSVTNTVGDGLRFFRLKADINILELELEPPAGLIF